MAFTSLASGTGAAQIPLGGASSGAGAGGGGMVGMLGPLGKMLGGSKKEAKPAKRATLAPYTANQGLRDRPERIRLAQALKTMG